MHANLFIASLSERLSRQFVETRKILTFEEYLTLFMAQPRRYARSAEQYVLDVFDYYGRREGGEGFRLFDAPFGEESQRLIGQEEAQERVYHLLRGFVQAGRANKILTLVGPNGSAKSSFIACLMRAMEDYSRRDEGALYRFNWIFPVERLNKERLGFVRDEFAQRQGARDSFALLDESLIACKIPCELRDNPLLLLPVADRNTLFCELAVEHDDFARMPLSDYLRRGDLSPKSKAVFDSLLTSYGGDIHRVLQHVQVERYDLSLRYKVGAVVVEPEMTVDAHLRQVAADLRYADLPPVLKAAPMFEPVGKLIDANHGVLEFSDMLKRPLDSFKYLLSTCETGMVNLDLALLNLDLVFFASTNDLYVEAFRKVPDFPSFQGRMEFVTVPYLYDFTKEQQIYDRQLRLERAGMATAPHVTEIAALWAVMTRMRKPEYSRYHHDIQEVIRRMSPLDKALLYAGRSLPWPTEQQRLILAREMSKLRNEFSLRSDYEGQAGVSPREVKQLLLTSFQAASLGSMTPVRLLEAIGKLIEHGGGNAFITLKPDGDYMNHLRILGFAEDYYLDILESEVRGSLQLVEAGRYEELLKRYVRHVSAKVKGEKVHNPLSRAYEEPSEHLMREVEDLLNVADRERDSFRGAVLTRIGAEKLEHPESVDVDYEQVFRKELAHMEQNYHQSQKAGIARVCGHALSLLTEERIELAEAEHRDAHRLIDGMANIGYPSETIAEVLEFLRKKRYR